MSLLAAWFWPKVKDRKNALFAIQEAYCVAAALGVITAIFAVLGFMRGTSEGLDVEALASALLFGGAAFGIYRKSRIAAVTGLVIYLAGRGYAWVRIGPSMGVIPVLVTLALLHGVRGTFAYQRLPPRPAGLPSLAQSFQALEKDPENSEKTGGPAQEGSETSV